MSSSFLGFGIAHEGQFLNPINEMEAVLVADPVHPYPDMNSAIQSALHNLSKDDKFTVFAQWHGLEEGDQKVEFLKCEKLR